MNQHYTPDISDIHIGYECEVNNARGYKETFEPLIIGYKIDGGYKDEIGDIIAMIDDGYGEVRTPYLTKEQIEAEGWKPLDVKSPFTGRPFKWVKSREEGFNHWHVYTLEFENPYHVQIHYTTETSYVNENKYIFSGRCPSINEFRKLSKLLGIN